MADVGGVPIPAAARAPSRGAALLRRVLSTLVLLPAFVWGGLGAPIWGFGAPGGRGGAGALARGGAPQASAEHPRAPARVRVGRDGRADLGVRGHRGAGAVARAVGAHRHVRAGDRKSTRLNSS